MMPNSSQVDLDGQSRLWPVSGRVVTVVRYFPKWCEGGPPNRCKQWSRSVDLTPLEQVNDLGGYDRISSNGPAVPRGPC
jgi:hypothetical protein